MKTKKTSSSSIKQKCLARTIRFHDQAQMELINAAAVRRGWSFNAFVVRAAKEAAERTMERPAVELFANREAATDAA